MLLTKLITLTVSLPGFATYNLEIDGIVFILEEFNPILEIVPTTVFVLESMIVMEVETPEGLHKT